MLPRHITQAPAKSSRKYSGSAIVPKGDSELLTPSPQPSWRWQHQVRSPASRLRAHQEGAKRHPAACQQCRHCPG